MATKYLDEVAGKAIVSESKKYSVKVSAVTVNETVEADGSKTVKFTQNGKQVAELVLDKEKYTKDFELVYASDPAVTPDPGVDDTRIENPDFDDTQLESDTNKKYLDEGNYYKYVVEGAAEDGTDKTVYVKAARITVDTITEDDVIDWFKDESTITLNDGVVVTTVNGDAPDAGQKYFTGDELVLTAPTTDSNSKALVAVTVNGEEITTDTSTGVANYEISDFDYEVEIGAVYEQ